MHLWWGLADPDPMTKTMLTLNGVGYIGLAGALVLPFSPVKGVGWLRWVLIGYTAVTFLAFFLTRVLPTGDWAIPAGPIAKLAEAGLLAILWMDRK
jgi:hypothetical protein